MTLGAPPMPASIGFYNAYATITAPDYGDLSASGMPKRSVGTNTTNVPCRLDVASGAESERYAHLVDETAFRFICPVADPSGAAYTIKKDYYITIGGVKYQSLGAGRPEGLSGQQTVILKKEDR